MNAETLCTQSLYFTVAGSPLEMGHMLYGHLLLQCWPSYWYVGSLNNAYSVMYAAISVFQINVVFLVLVLRSIYKSRMSKTTKKSMKGKKENKEKEVAK